MPSSSPLNRFSSKLRSSIPFKKGKKSRESSPIASPRSDSSNSPRHASPNNGERVQSRIADLRERRKNAFSSEFKVGQNGELMPLASSAPSSAAAGEVSGRSLSPRRSQNTAPSSPKRAGSSPKLTKKSSLSNLSPLKLRPLAGFKRRKKSSSSSSSKHGIENYEESAKNFTTNTQFLKLAYEKIFDTHDLDRIASPLVQLSLALGTTSTMMEALLQFEFEKSAKHYRAQQILLRNSLCTKCLDSFIEIEGRQYIKEVILPLVVDMLRYTNMDLEVDPLQMQDPLQMEKNISNLQKYVLEFLHTLKENDRGILAMPFQMRFICSIIHKLSEENGWDPAVNVGAFILNRLIQPALLAADRNHLITGELTAKERRNFFLMVQVLQKLVSGQKFLPNEHESFLIPLNSFIEQHSEEFRQFLLDLSPHPSIARIEQRKLSRMMDTQFERRTITLKHSTELEGIVDLMEQKYHNECTQELQCSREDLKSMWQTGQIPSPKKQASSPKRESVPISQDTLPQKTQELNSETEEKPTNLDTETNPLSGGSNDGEKQEEMKTPDHVSETSPSKPTEQDKHETLADDAEGKSSDLILSDADPQDTAEEEVQEVEAQVSAISDSESQEMPSERNHSNSTDKQATAEDPIPTPITATTLIPEPVSQPVIDREVPIPMPTIQPTPTETEAVQVSPTPLETSDQSIQHCSESPSDHQQIAEVEEIRAQYEVIKKQYASLQDENNTLKTKNDQLKEDLRNQQAQHEQEQKSFVQQRATQLNESSAHFDKLKEEKRKLQAEFEEQQQIMREMKASIDKERVTLEKHKQIVELDAKAQNEKERELEERERLLKSKQNAQRNEHEHSQQKITALEDELTEAKKQLSTIQEKLSEEKILHGSAQSKLHTENTQLKEKLSSLEGDKRDMEEQLENMKNSLQSQRDSEETMEQLRKQLAVAEKDLEAERRKYENYTSEATQNEDLSLQVQTLSSEKEHLQNQLSMQEVEIKLLQKRLSRWEGDESAASGETVPGVSSDGASGTNTTSRAPQDSESNISASNASSLGEIQLLAAKNKLQEQVESLRKQLQDSEKMSHESRSRAQQLEKQVEALQHEKIELTDDLDSVTHELEQLRQSKSLLTALNSRDSQLQIQALEEIQDQQTLLKEKQREFTQKQRHKKREIRLLVEELNDRAREVRQKEIQANRRLRAIQEREEQLQNESYDHQRRIDNISDDLYDALQEKKLEAETRLNLLMKQIGAAKEEYDALKTSIRDMHALQGYSMNHLQRGAASPRSQRKRTSRISSPSSPRGSVKSKSHYASEDDSPHISPRRGRRSSKVNSARSRRQRPQSPDAPTRRRKNPDLLEGLRAFSPPRTSLDSSPASSVTSANGSPSASSEASSRMNSPKRRVSSGGRHSWKSPTKRREKTSTDRSSQNVQLLKRIISRIEGSQQGVQALLEELPPRELEDMVKMYFTQQKTEDV